MGKGDQPDPETSRPVGIEFLVVDLMNRLLDVPLAAVDDEIDAVLEHVGQSCGFDRTFVFRFDPVIGYSLSHEWIAGTGRIHTVETRTYAPDACPDWHRDLAAGRTIAIYNRDDLVPGSPERSVLERLGVRSMLNVPLRDGDRLIGIIGFDCNTQDRHWASGEIFLLTSIGRAVSSVVLRGQADAAEAETRRHLEATLRALPDLVIELCPEGTLRACYSNKLPWLSGLVRTGIGKPVHEVLPEPLAQALTDAMVNLPEFPTTRTRRVEVASLVAPQRYEVSVAPLELAVAGQPVGVVAVIRDLSSAEQTSEMASYREGQFAAFFEMSPHPILLLDFDSGALLDGNRAFKRIFSLDPQVATLNVRRILPEEAAWLIDDATGQLNKTGTFGPVEAQLSRAGGDRFPALLRGFMSIDPNGRRLVWALIEDVTDIRAKEAALRAEQGALEATRARLVAAIEALDDGFAIFDADDRLVLWNSPYTRVFADIADLIREGALYDDLLRAAIERGIFGSESMRDQASLQRRLDRPLTAVWDGEDEFADGRLMLARERATPARETVGLYQDVTARRLAARRLQQVVDSGEVAVWDWDSERGFSTINDLWGTMLGQDSALSLDGLHALVHVADRAALADTQRAVFAGRTQDFNLSCRLRHREGHWAWLLTRGRVIARHPDGRPWRISGITLDVTAQSEAEQRLTRLIDGARVGTWEYDMRKGRTTINDRWAEIVGYRAVEIGPIPLDRWLAMIHPDDVQMMLAKEQRLFDAGHWLIEHEMRLRHRDGHWVWVLSRGQVIEWDAAGRPLVITGVHLDITAAKALETALARERETLARIMEASISGIIAVDGQGRVVFANAAAESALGRAIAPGEDLPSLLHAAEVTDSAGLPVSAEDLPLTRALAGEPGLHRLRHAIVWPSGDRRIVSVTAARLTAPGTDLAAVCTFTDVTAEVETEDRLRAAMTTAEAANRAKSDFLAAMSHEIRTPLNGVLGMANVLAQRLSDPGDQAMLRIIRDSGEHLLGVINDILDLAKIEAGRLVLYPRAIRLDDILERVAALHRLAATERGLRLTTRLAGCSAGDLRFGDEQRLIQILHNLLGNALKFTDEGEVSVLIDCQSHDRVVIEVQDTGIGMSEAEISRMFEEFAQGHGASRRSHAGTGLGLPIVRRLARMMGGEVTLASPGGRGIIARVELLIPVLAGATADSDDQPAPQLPAMRVLAAEDNGTNQIILASMLQALGVEAVIVGGGAEAQARFRDEDFDAVLLDISMPGMDGIETLAALAEDARTQKRSPLQAIAVTANAMTHQVEAYRAHGFAAVVAKPIRLDLLADALLLCHRQRNP
jgi:PAS domain S-box-containing protein